MFAHRSFGRSFEGDVATAVGEGVMGGWAAVFRAKLPMLSVDAAAFDISCLGPTAEGMYADKSMSGAEALGWTSGMLMLGSVDLKCAFHSPS